MLSTAHRRRRRRRPAALPPRPLARPGPHDPLQVVVLMGGVGAEREVSLASGRAVTDALIERGHEAAAWVLDTDDERELDGLPRDAHVVFLALHGEYGEDGRIQAALERRGLCYTGSDPQASARAFDKAATKRALAAAGLPLARDRVLPADFTERDLRHAVRLAPVGTTVVKPTRMGSSVGVVVCRDRSQLVRALRENARYGQPQLIEEFIPGHELTVGILGEDALPLVEPVPAQQHYDYRAKYDAGSGTTYRIEPTTIPVAVRALARFHAARAHQVLGCRHFSRVDFRYDPDRGRLALLEVNTIPGMTATSLLPKAAAAAGLAFPDLVDLLCRQALGAAA